MFQPAKAQQSQTYGSCGCLFFYQLLHVVGANVFRVCSFNSFHGLPIL